MRKNSLLWLVILLITVGCKGSSEKGYTVEGQFIVPEIMVYLCVKNGNETDTLASSKLVNGKFKFTGVTEHPAMTYIDYGEEKGVPVVLDNNNYHFTVNVLNYRDAKYVGDSEEQSIYSEYLEIEKLYSAKVDSTTKVFQRALRYDDKVAEKEAIQGYENVRTEQRKVENELIKKYPDSYSALMVTYKWRNDMNGYAYIDRMNMLGTKYADTKIYKDMLIKKEASKNITVGLIAPDFTLKTDDGEDVSLYEMKGKIKIVDFWASWCGPCRGLNPHMLELYNKYKEKGLEIVGVSMDTNRENWLRAVKQDGMPWKQVSDLQAWEGDVAKKYNVESIPHVVVLNENNRMLAVNIYADELTELLKKEFGF